MSRVLAPPRPLPRRLWLALAAVLAGALLVAASNPASSEDAERESSDRSRVGPAPGDLMNVAHRGSGGMAPDNTIPGFQLALDQGANWIETDLHLTSDDEVVLVHDASLASTTNAQEVFPDRSPWMVEDFTLEEIRQLDAGASFNPRFEGEQVPTLREFIDLVGQRAGVALDVKEPHRYPGLPERIVEELEAVPGYLDAAIKRDKIKVFAFDHDFLADLREVRDDIPQVPMWGAGNVPSWDELVEAAEYADMIVTAFDNVANDPRVAGEIADAGLEFGLYTMNTAEEMYDAVDLGARAIITDYPVVFKDLVDRGLIDLEFDPPEDERETHVIETDYYRLTLTTAPEAAIDRLELAPDGDGQYRSVLNRSTRGTIPFVGVGAFSPTERPGVPGEIVESEDGAKLELLDVPMGGQPVTFDWTFWFDEETFDHEMTWHVEEEVPDVYQIGWGLDANLDSLGDAGINDRERGHARPYPDPAWSIQYDDDITVAVAYEQGSAWAEDNIFFSTFHNFVAWTPWWDSGGRDWPEGTYPGGRHRIGGSSDGGDADYAQSLWEGLNATDGDGPSYETAFNYPSLDGTGDPALEQRVMQLLGSAPEGSEVHASFYTWSRTGMAQAFIDAVEDGVDVNIVLDNSNVHDNGEYWNAVQLLLDEIGDRVTVCNADIRDDRQPGCIGDNINHNKFITFSELGDGSEHVVLQSSANFTNPQLNEHNGMVLVRDDEALYDAFRTYWDDQQSQEMNPDYHWTAEGDSNTVAQFFPKAEGDPVIDELDDVACTDDSRIRTAASLWTQARLDLVDRLGELVEEGCTVEAVVQEHGNSAPVLDAFDGTGVDVTVFPQAADAAVHHKYMLIDSEFADGQSREIVLMGSHNYNGTSLRSNDEVLLRIEDADVFEDFSQNWETVQQQAALAE